MFGPALLAASDAARTWSPECAASCAPARCCPLCHVQYRSLVLDGPLLDLPHVVAHAAVAVIDCVIVEQVAAVEERFDRDPWNGLLDEDERAEAVSRRILAARGGLLLAASDELAEAHEELSELRRRYTEPVFAGLLAGTRIDGVPEAWG